MLISAFSISAFAEIPDSANVSYTARRLDAGEVRYADFTVTYDGTNYKGCCAEIRVDMADSGTGRVDRKYTSGKYRAAMYYMIYDQKWVSGPNATSDAHGVIPAAPTGWYRRYIPEVISQYIHQGTYAYGVWGSGSTEYDRAKAFCDWYDTFDPSSVDVPDEFVVYYMDAGSDQNFVMWGLEEPGTGIIKLKKASGIPSITG